MNIDQNAKVTWLPANLLPPLSFCEQDFLWARLSLHLKSDGKKVYEKMKTKNCLYFTSSSLLSFSKQTLLVIVSQLLHAYSLHLNVQTFNILSNMTISIFTRIRKLWLEKHHWFSWDCRDDFAHMAIQNESHSCTPFLLMLVEILPSVSTGARLCLRIV